MSLSAILGRAAAAPLSINTLAAVTDLNFASALIDATGERIAFCGPAWFQERTGTKTIVRVQFSFGTVSKGGGSGLTVSLQDVSTAAVPMQPDGTQDQTVAIANANASFVSNTWIRTDAFSASRDVAFGENLAVVIEFDGSGRQGSDAVNVRGVRTVSSAVAHFSVTTLRSAAGVWTSQAIIPNILLEFSDGTFGTILGGFPVSNVSWYLVRPASSPNEAGLQFSFPGTERVDVASAVIDQGHNDCQLTLYADTTALRTCDLPWGHARHLPATNNEGARPANMVLDGAETLDGGEAYILGFKQIEANDALSSGLYYYEVEHADHWQAHAGGLDWMAVDRTDAGAWTERPLRRPFLWPHAVLEPLPLQKVTQLVLQVGISEDADNDPPMEESEEEGSPVGICVGGGTVASGTNPAAGTSLATATTPLVWIELTVGATTYRWAKAGIPHGAPKEGRVKSFGHVRRSLTDDDGGLTASRVTSVVIDTDRLIRGLWVSGQLRGSVIEYYAADLATLIAGGTAQRRFRGEVIECAFDTDLEATIVSVDALTARLTSADADDRQLPHVLIGTDVGDQNPLERMFDKPVPYAYGSVREWECKFIASITVSGHEDLGNMHAFLVCLGAISQGLRVSGGDVLSGDPPVSRVALPESAFTGSDPYIYVPTMDGYFGANPWYEANGRRYTLIFGRDGHPVIEMARSGRIPLLFSFCGYETVGDSSGNTINAPARLVLHLMNNYLVQDATDDWLAIAAFGSYSLFDTASFAAVHAICDALGLEAGGVIGSSYVQASWRDVIGDICRQFGFDLGQNRHGQVMAAMLDRASTATIAAAFTPNEILEHTVDVDLRAGAVENEIRYVYDQQYASALADLTPIEGSRLPKDPYDGKWASGLQRLQDSASITALGGGTTGLRRSRVQEYSLINLEAVALAVATQRLDLKSPPKGRPEVRFSVIVRDGDTIELGDIVTLEHWDLPWSGSRRCQVREIDDDLDEHVIRPLVRDVEDLLL